MARLTVYPQYLAAPQWLDRKSVRRQALEWADAEGSVRDDDSWRAGVSEQPPQPTTLANIGNRGRSCGIRERLDACLARRHWRSTLTACCPCLVRGGRMLRRVCGRRPAASTRRSATLVSPTSLTATSTTPTCANTAAAFAPFQKAGVRWLPDVALPMTSTARSFIRQGSGGGGAGRH